jgi:diaminohydroxyphosphoribosylaminopyrimidine deaminase/5-amino-6-(5-phosphoribosylamino)uracil reductase
LIDAGPMRRALELAAGHRTHPNPRVGAVVVGESGGVIGEGAHEGAGHPHAEALALEKAGSQARGATLYVTLEPCCHQGRTPPCVTAVASAGIARVVVGAIDPDERVSGKGVSWLEDAGIEVVTGLLADEAEAVDRAYFHHRRTGLPLVTLKMAQTLDGSVAAGDGSSRWITSDAARRDAHLLRAAMDAIVIGAGTLRSDDPILTARVDPPVQHQPTAVIVAGREPLPVASRIWERAPLVISAMAREIPAGDLVIVDADREGLPDPVASARALGERGLYDVLLEGGAALAGSWWRSGVIGRGVVYLAGRVGGGSGVSPLGGDFATMAQSREVTIRDIRMVGPDVRIEFE